MIKVTHPNGEVLTINYLQYGNGRIALHVSDSEGLPYAMLSVNVPDVELGTTEVIIKNYGENAMLEKHICKQLVSMGILSETGRHVEMPFNRCPVYRIEQNEVAEI